MDVRLHFVKDILSKEEIEMMKIHISDNPGDMLTKVVTVSNLIQMTEA